MARQCSVCAHPDRAEIDQAIARGASLREIARAHAGISRQAIARHKSGGHIAERIEKAAVAEDLAEAETVADEIRGLKRLAKTFMSAAAERGQFRTALQGVRELARLVELTVSTNSTPESEEPPHLVIVKQMPNGEEVVESDTEDQEPRPRTPLEAITIDWEKAHKQ